jgi:hypothetical protein
MRYNGLGKFKSLRPDCRFSASLFHYLNLDNIIDISILPREANNLSMLSKYLIFVSLIMTPVPATEQLERYWSGRPQAIGIDISPSFM